MNRTEKAAKRLRFLACFTFVVSPLLAWIGIISSDENAVFASISRLIWYSGDPLRIFISMLFMFIPMIISFFFAQDLMGMTKPRKAACRIFMIVSCAILYLGAMEIMPSDGETMTKVNVWHGILSFGGIAMIFLTYCLYAIMIMRTDRDGAGLLGCFLVFTLISTGFAVLNVFDEKSYVIASAVSELYVLTMLSLIGFMTYYLAYRKAKGELNTTIE